MENQDNSNASDPSQKGAGKGPNKGKLPDFKSSERNDIPDDELMTMDEKLVRGVDALIVSVGQMKGDINLLRKEMVQEQRIVRGMIEDLQVRMSSLESAYTKMSSSIAATKSEIGVLKTTVKDNGVKKKITREF